MTRIAAALALALLAAVPATVTAQAPGTHAAAVLRLAPAPRADALGGAYAASAADPFAIRFNPAAAAALQPGVAAAFRTHPGDVALGAAAAAFDVGGLAAGLSLAFLDLGEVREMVPDPSVGGQRGIPTGGTVDGGELALGLAVGHRLGPVDVGVGATLVQSWMAEVGDAGLAFDVGARRAFMGGRLALGAAVLGLGPETGPGRSAELPRILRAGGELRLGGGARPRALVAAALAGPEDALRPVGGVEVRVGGPGGGALVLRGGYHGEVDPGDALSRWALGGSVEVGPLTLDYAWRGMGVLGDAHVVGVRWRGGDGGADGT